VVVSCQQTILPRITSHFLAQNSLASKIQRQEQQVHGWRSDVSTPTLLYVVRTLQWPHQEILQDWLDHSILPCQLRPFKNHVPVSSLMPEKNYTPRLIFTFLISKINMTLQPYCSIEILPLIHNSVCYCAFSSKPAILANRKNHSTLLPVPSLQPRSHYLCHFNGAADLAWIFLVQWGPCITREIILLCE